VPPANQAPFLAKEDLAQLSVSFLPITNLKVANTYLFDRLRDRASGANIFNNHIVRSKWNWQFNRELSVRVIMQYTATLANPVFTELTTSKRFNADFLITYLLRPGTAVYLGYNSDLQNNNGPRYVNDSRQFFVKVSYLFRF